MLHHPATDDIDLATVMGVLGDQTRLAILGDLERRGNMPMKCSHFINLASKSNLTYHLGKMREAGIIRVEPNGTAKMITIRRADLDRRFPGFLDAVLSAAVTMAPPFDEFAEAE